MVSIQATSAPPAFQALDLFDKGRDRVFIGEAPSGICSSPVGPTDPAVMTFRGAGFGDGARDFCGPLVELVDPVVGLMKLQSVACAAKGIGENDVGAGIHEVLMQLGDVVRFGLVPHLGASPRFEPHGEERRACGAIGKQNALRAREIGKSMGCKRTFGFARLNGNCNKI